MAPQHLYFLALALIAVPLLPFSRTALVVCAAWVLGQFAYLASWNTDVVDMVVAVLAAGVALGVAANARDQTVAWLFLVTAGVKFCVLDGSLHPYYGWWTDFYLAMARVFMLPLTINLQEINRVRKAFKERRDWDDIYWRRVLCW